MTPGLKLVASVLSAAAFAAAAPPPPGAAGEIPTAPDPLASLYAERRYFELREALDDPKAGAAAEVEFYRGAVDQVFNRLEDSIARLEQYLRDTDAGADPLKREEACYLLAESFTRRGCYQKAAETYRQILQRFGPVLSPEEKAICENQEQFVAALAGFPPMSVRIDDDTTIGMIDRRFPVLVNDRTVFFKYDTGSSVSILCWSAAAVLDVSIQGPPVRIQTGTGEWIDGRIGVIPEMRMGSVFIRNAVFVILPDEALLPMKLRPGEIRGGLLGLPVLAAFREFTETRDGDLIIPARPGPRAGGNTGFYGFRLFVEIVHRGDRLALFLDSGADSTVLHPPFYRRFRGLINNSAPPAKARLEAVGGARTVPVRLLDEFAFDLGGKNLALRRVAVQMNAAHAGSRHFYGNLGLDVFRECKRITFNFESMSVSAE